MGVERPVNYLLKEKAGSTMLELKTFLDSSRLGPRATRSFKPLNYSHNFSNYKLTIARLRVDSSQRPVRGTELVGWRRRPLIPAASPPATPYLSRGNGD